MAKVSFNIDTRKKSKSSITGLISIALKVFTKEPVESFLATLTPWSEWDRKTNSSVISSFGQWVGYHKINARTWAINSIGPSKCYNRAWGKYRPN